MKKAICTVLLFLSLFSLSPETSGMSAISVMKFKDYISIDHFETGERQVDISLVSERGATHGWSYACSDESVLACVGAELSEKTTVFSFEGISAGVCDVIFEYARVGRNTPVLITEVFRFYVDPSLNVTYERVFFETNGT